MAAGNNLQLPVSQVNGTLYAAYNDFEGTVGPANKAFATGGGYNQFSPDVQVTTQAPLVLESARLYIGHGGKITFTAFDADGVQVSSRTLQVRPTRSPAAPDAQPDDATDKGAIYYLGLELPEAGDYRIVISYEDGATIFRNNVGVKGYPFEIPNVLSITGNTASTTPEEYYYYFYDLKVRGLGCESERVAVPLVEGAPLPKPVVTRNGQKLISSIEGGSHQWFIDGRPVEGATGQELTPTSSGLYTVMVAKDGCISEASAALRFDFESAERAVSADLLAFPNPSKHGMFSLTLETQGPEDIAIEVVDLLGKQVYTGAAKQFNGQYRTDIDLTAHSSGLYILRVQHGDKLETSKLLIRR